MDEAFDLEIRLKYPKEAAMWQAIHDMLHRDQATFFDFFSFFGEAPTGFELRPKRDGKRSPFRLDHFAWVPIGTPKRADRALAALTAPSGVQEQIDDLRARVEALEARPKIERPKTQIFAAQAVQEHWCVIDTGRNIGRFQIDQGAMDRPGLISVHSTEDEAQSAVMALINGGSNDRE